MSGDQTDQYKQQYGGQNPYGGGGFGCFNSQDINMEDFKDFWEGIDDFSEVLRRIFA